MMNSTSRLESNSEFTYSDLPDPANHIRLLEVTSAEDAGPVKCDLSVWPTESAPPYNAISYTWGDPNSNTNIFINDQRVTARTNCDYALRQAFWYDSSQYIWIDALCINQGDIPEKNFQVAMMGQIYGSAQRVLACVGPHADDSEYIWHTIKGSRSLCEKYWTETEEEYRMYGSPPNKFQRENKIAWSISRWKMRYSFPRALRAYLHFTARSYFERIWIVQELFMAQETTLCCGADNMPVGYFIGHTGLMSALGHTNDCILDETTLQWRTNSVHRCLLGLIRWSDWRERRRLRKFGPIREEREGAKTMMGFACQKGRGKLSFRDGFKRTRYFQCQEALDTVYAIISLVEWGDRPIIPDYNKSALALGVEVLEHHRESVSFDDLCALTESLVATLHLDESHDDVRQRKTALSSPLPRRVSLEASNSSPFVIARTEAYYLSPGPSLKGKRRRRNFYTTILPAYPGLGTISRVFGTVDLQKGDRIIELDFNLKFHRQIFLIARQDNEDSYSLIGYAISDPREIADHPVESCLVDLYVDAEDLIMYSAWVHSGIDLVRDSAIPEKDYRSQLLSRFPERFCRLKGSSYAIRASEPKPSDGYVASLLTYIRDGEPQASTVSSGTTHEDA